MDNTAPYVEGIVIDKVTLKPISEARIEAADKPSLHAITDADGKFKFGPYKKLAFKSFTMPLSSDGGTSWPHYDQHDTIKVIAKGYKIYTKQQHEFEVIPRDDSDPLRWSGPFRIKPIVLEPIDEK